MRTVVDASVALKWYFPELGSDQAKRVLAEAIDGERQLLAPDLILIEFANVLWKKVQREECDRGEAEEILDAFGTDAPRLVASVPLVPRALELALRLGEVVYDCVYLAAAIEGEASLVTADARLARCARSVLADVERVG
jgi:predicted nucleic acid-binding protein